MEIYEIKSQMMKLWKDTFHDSDEYIHIVFDNYFDPDLIAYTQINGKIIAALLAVPYDFIVNIHDREDVGIFDRGIHKNFNRVEASDFNSLKGLYLCGLATKESYRRGGIMTELIEKINAKAKNRNYDFTFLIPADTALEYFYSRRGYVNAFKRYENNFVAGYEFVKDQKSADDKILIIDSLTLLSSIKLCINVGGYVRSVNICNKYVEENIYNETDEFIIKAVDEYVYDIVSAYEINNRGVTLLHSQNDIRAIVEENLFSGGNIFISDSAVAIISFADDKVIIPHIFYRDITARDEMLQAVSNKYPQKPIIYYSYAEDKNNRQLEPKNYGMMRFLKVAEILKFVAESSSDLKFSILMKDADQGEPVLYNAHDGQLTTVNLTRPVGAEISKCQNAEESAGHSSIKMTDESAKPKNGGEVTELSARELTEILSRKPETPDYAQMAFSLPRIQFCMSYMLD